MIGLKTLWEKEKMLVKPAFSPFPILFSKGFLPGVVKKLGLCDKELTLYHTTNILDWSKSKAFL